MSEGRSSGFSSQGGGYINFKGNDHSGMVTGIPDKRRSKDQDAEKETDENKNNENEFKESEFVDRSAQLRASLNSLAMINVAGIIKKKKIVDPKEEEFDEDSL
jgi:hypothetical protein